mgnify:CR=1 FL=1
MTYRDLSELPKGSLTHDEAVSIATETRQDPRFVEAILQETTRLNGSVRHHCPGAVLTELKPGGMRGSILIANAGLIAQVGDALRPLRSDTTFVPA